jgi:uncharacterized protein
VNQNNDEGQPERSGAEAEASALEKEIVMQVRTCLSIVLGLLMPLGVSAALREESSSQTTNQIQSERSVSEFASLRGTAGNGNAVAQYKLGSLYMNGSDVQQNYVEAAKWFKLAAVQGLAEAQFDLGYLYQEGKGVTKDYIASASYYRAAAEQGHPTAQNNLASLYERGWGVPKDLAEAVRWYRAAAEHGNSIAQCNLATAYLMGRGVRQDDKQAASWFLAAAQQGLPPAQNNLAFMYYTGRGVPRDYVQAAAFTRRAAEQGYALAETDLGYLYEQGKGVPLDHIAACEWYIVGMSGGDDRGLARLKSLSELMSPKDIAEAKRVALSYMRQRGKTSEVFQADSKASMLDQQ